MAKKKVAEPAIEDQPCFGDFDETDAVCVEDCGEKGREKCKIETARRKQLKDKKVESAEPKPKEKVKAKPKENSKKDKTVNKDDDSEYFVKFKEAGNPHISGGAFYAFEALKQSKSLKGAIKLSITLFKRNKVTSDPALRVTKVFNRSVSCGIIKGTEDSYLVVKR